MTVAVLNEAENDVSYLKSWVESEGFLCSLYSNADDFQKKFLESAYDAVIVFDTGLPSIEFIRNNVCGLIPIVYIESIARIKAVFRRLGLNDCCDDDQYVIDCSPFKIDVNKKGFYISNQKIKLTRKEYDLILYLFRHVGKLISRGRLLQVVWGTSPKLNTRTVDAHISRLRSKLGINPVESGWELKSIYNQGYCLAKVSDKA